MKTAASGIPGYEIHRKSNTGVCGNLFNNSSKRSLGVKTAGQFFKGYETCQDRYEELQLSENVYLRIYTKIFLLTAIYNCC